MSLVAQYVTALGVIAIAERLGVSGWTTSVLYGMLAVSALAAIVLRSDR